MLPFHKFPSSFSWSSTLARADTKLREPTVLLDIQNIRPVEWDKKAFDRLVLDAKTKELIYALVDVQNSGGNKIHDIIKGKGNGLIILLHGSPGTGKTLTAERFAFTLFLIPVIPS